jgi:RNA polymerase sigma factor (sigma-70 family)
MEQHPEDQAFREYRATGDAAALARVFDATALGLLLLAGHLAPGSSEAEDLVQDTFLTALRDAGRWDGERPVRLWLAGILRHRALHTARTRRQRATAPLEAAEGVADGGGAPLDVAGSRETFDAVVSALDQIDGPSREVLALRLLHGLAPTEIAHTLGRPPGAVRMQLARGLARLRPLVPAGAALAAWTVGEGRGLAAVRDTIVAAAGRETAVVSGASLATTSTFTLGAFAVKHWFAVASLLVLVGLGLRATLGSSPAARDTRTLTHEPDRAPSDVLPEPVAQAEVTERRAAEATAPSVEPSAAEPTTTDSANAPPRTTVTGRVFDLTGAPVAGAVVHSFVPSASDTLPEVARTDENGRFVATELADNARLVARATGWQPSAVHEVRPGEVEDLQLVLGAVGHAVTGRVLDPEGRGVPHARVALGVDEDAREELRGSDNRPGGQRKVMDLESILLRADSEGRFTCNEVPAGYVLVLARPANSSPLVGVAQLDVTFGGDASVDVQLAPGGEVYGRVADGRGRPLVGVTVRARWEGTDALGQLEDELGPVYSSPTTKTDQDGRYVLAGLLPGEYDLYALADAFTLAQSGIELEERARALWDVTVEHASSLRIHATDDTGAPLARWRVELLGGASHGLEYRRVVWLDHEGRGTLHGLPEADTYDLGLDAPGADGRYDDLFEALRPGVASTGGVVELRVARGEAPNTGVRGRWPVALAAAEDVRLALRASDGSRRYEIQPTQEGGFELLGIEPGSYVLQTHGGGFPSGERLATCDVAHGEVCDLGLLAPPTLQVLHVHPVAGLGMDVSEVELALFDAARRTDTTFTRVDDRFVSSPTRPGHHVLLVAPSRSDATWAPTELALEVTSAPIQDVTVPLAVGRAIELRVDAGEGIEVLPTSLRVRVRTAGGDPLQVLPSSLLSRGQGLVSRDLWTRTVEVQAESTSFTTSFRLAPGRYTVEVRDATPARRGIVAAELEVGGELEAGTSTIPLRLLLAR